MTIIHIENARNKLHICGNSPTGPRLERGKTTLTFYTQQKLRSTANKYTKFIRSRCDYV